MCYLVQAHSPSWSPTFPLVESSRCLAARRLSPQGGVASRGKPLGGRPAPWGPGPSPAGLTMLWETLKLAKIIDRIMYPTLSMAPLDKGGQQAAAKTLSPEELKISTWNWKKKILFQKKTSFENFNSHFTEKDINSCTHSLKLNSSWILAMPWWGTWGDVWVDLCLDLLSR